MRETSIAAEQSIEPIKTKIQKLVYEFFMDQPHGAIDQAAEDYLSAMYGYHPSTIRMRRVELMKIGVIRDSGRTGLTRSKRRAIVWEVAR